MEQIEVSVVVPTRDRSERLARLLDSLREQTIGPERFEVIVVDNGSVDSTPQLLSTAAAKDGLRLRVARRKRGDGPASARNEGWRMASAPLVAFTDDDCEARPDWLERILAAASDRPGAGIQGRTEVNPREVGEAGPFSRVLQVKKLGPFYATCNIVYPRELLERLGGFDETSYARQPGSEDTDLAWRALEAGTRIDFAPDAVVHHGVVRLGPVGKLRWALRWSDAMRVFARHPALRRELRWGLFWKSSHALLLLAVVGVALSPRLRLAALLALPYARHLRARCKVERAPLYLAPYIALYDAVETYATARGAMRSGVAVL